MLKFNKGNGIALLDNEDYVKSVEQLFNNQTKCKIFDKDPTVTQMTTLQNYFQKLHNKGDISTAEFYQMRPKNAKPERHHDFPKIHKTLTNILKFRPIIHTTGYSYYLVGKFIVQYYIH